jgi:putative addiction module antidote
MITIPLKNELVARSMNICNNKGPAMHTLKLVQIGNSVGVVLPKEVLARLKLEKGESVYLTDTPYGVAMTPYDPAIDDQIAAGREFMREYRDTFHALAK